jgi:hypothetical protein
LLGRIIVCFPSQLGNAVDEGSPGVRRFELVPAVHLAHVDHAQLVVEPQQVGCQENLLGGSLADQGFARFLATAMLKSYT